MKDGLCGGKTGSNSASRCVPGKGLFQALSILSLKRRGSVVLVVSNNAQMSYFRGE